MTLMSRIFIVIFIIFSFIGGDCLKPSILVIGGSGRVGGSAVKALYQQYHENFLISVGGRSYDNWKSYCDLKRLKLNDYGWRNVDITSKESIQSPIRDFDLIINTAGPFQGLRDPILLRESLRLGKRYIDVCDDIELSRIATSKEFQLIAKEGNGKAVISTGIWPVSYIHAIRSPSFILGFNRVFLRSLQRRLVIN